MPKQSNDCTDVSRLLAEVLAIR